MSATHTHHASLLAADLYLEAVARGVFSKQASGGLIGAGVGGLLGTMIGANTDRARVGGKIGDLIGNIVGKTTPRPYFTQDPFGNVADRLTDYLYRYGHGADMSNRFAQMSPATMPLTGGAIGAGLGGMFGSLFERDMSQQKQEREERELIRQYMAAQGLGGTEKMAADTGALIGALLGGGAGMLSHLTPSGNFRDSHIGKQLGSAAASVINTLTPGEAGVPPALKWLTEDSVNDARRSIQYPMQGASMGSGLPGALAATGVGALAGGWLGKQVGNQYSEWKDGRNEEQEYRKLVRQQELELMRQLLASQESRKKMAAAWNLPSTRRTQTPKPVSMPVDFRHPFRHVAQKITEDAGSGKVAIPRAVTDVLRDLAHFATSEQSHTNPKSWLDSIGMGSSTKLEAWRDKLLRRPLDPYTQVFRHQIHTAAGGRPEPVGYITNLQAQLDPQQQAYERMHGPLVPR